MNAQNVKIEIHRRRLKELFEVQPGSSAMNLMASWIFMGIFSDRLGSLQWIWFSFIVLSASLRIFFSRKYRERFRSNLAFTKAALLKLEKTYTGVLFFNALAWGSGMYAFYELANDSEKIITQIFTLGIISAGLTRTNASLRTSIAFSLGAVLPFTSYQAIIFFESGSKLHAMNFLAVLMFFGFLYMAAKQNFRYVLENVTLTLEKEQDIRGLEERIKLEEELKDARAVSIHSSKMASLGELAGNIAHEINNPLTIILGNTNVLQRQFKKMGLDSPRMLKPLERIEETTHRISKVIDSLRSYSHENETEELEPVSINELLSDSLSLIGEKLKINGITLKKKGDFDSIVLVKKVATTQIFLNLINNSIHAIQEFENRWIEIELRKNSETNTLMVRDSGEGISDEVVKEMFEPYFTTKPVGIGTGLGLSISRKLIEDMGGELRYEKEGNTCFSMEFLKKDSSKKDIKVS